MYWSTFDSSFPDKNKKEQSMLFNILEIANFKIALLPNPQAHALCVEFMYVCTLNINKKKKRKKIASYLRIDKTLGPHTARALLH